jgi:MFS family permease
MAIFKKKKTLVGNMTYMALMAAINVVFILLSAWIPALFILLIFILPLASTIVTYFCEKKYFVIYAIATILLCTLASFWDIGNVIFYVVPSLVSGFIFGLLIEKGVSPIIIILCGVLAQITLSYLAIPLVYLIYQRNIVTDFATIFSLQNYAYLKYVQNIFICVLAIIQQAISFMIIYEEISKMDINPHFEKKDNIIVPSATLGFIALSVLFAFVFPELSYSGMIFSLLLGFYCVGLLIAEKKRWIIVTLLISLILSLFIFSLLYGPINAATTQPLGLLGFQVFPLICAIIVFINNYLLMKSKKATIENRQP